ncbi:MAG: polyketide synthase, partial [Spirochaetales bacterium]|nr:polyketide synthase [Spirochaetales bacterium]
MKSKAAREPIVIAGIGCAFPGGADCPDAFWKLLLDGRDTVTTVPPSRWDADAFYHPDWTVYGKIHSKYGSFLSDEQLETFDPLFFGIPPLAAQKMDVQQRWLLEASFRALEDAGVGLETVDGSNCGVYIGVSAKEYGELVMSDHVRDVIDGNSIVGNSAAICSNRISYIFNLKGPSITMDTACSSSLVALHTACQAIWNGDIDAALVGGVNAILSPEVSLAFST